MEVLHVQNCRVLALWSACKCGSDTCKITSQREYNFIYIFVNFEVTTTLLYPNIYDLEWFLKIDIFPYNYSQYRSHTCTVQKKLSKKWQYLGIGKESYLGQI